MTVPEKYVGIPTSVRHKYVIFDFILSTFQWQTRDLFVVSAQAEVLLRSWNLVLLVIVVYN
jgi:hypothetical protein